MTYLLNEAASRRASDIHIEPVEDSLLIRLRVDGLLILFEEKEEAWGPPLISKLKLLAGLDIGERRLPQDGGFTTRSDQFDYDIRVSTLPLIYGEKIVLRLLPRNFTYTNLPSLGLDPNQCRDIRRMIHSSEGLILVTGPTGSGKTTTLYALLHEIHKNERNVVALEDPVEYHVTGINQVQINVRSGLTFSTGLRATLRQDPDVIFVGEIRDRETAEIAVRASLSGHLVLSSLHTPDTATAVVRLLDMGIEPYLAASALRCVIAQRLIRKLCTCRTSSEMCPDCRGTGYFGRQAVFEVLSVTEDLHPFIMHRASPAELRSYLISHGFCTLNAKLKEIVSQGVTTITEYQRMLVSDAE